MKQVAFHTLGCKLNYSETSTIARTFEEYGYGRTEEWAAADVFVLNTCSVTENADKKCRQLVGQLRKTNENAFVAIIGCYAQLKPDEIASIPGVDAVLGASEKFQLLELLGDFQRTQEARVLATDIHEAYHYHPAYSLNDRTRTFLKVQDGCNYHCSFCTIPLARGDSRSATIAQVLEAAKQIADRGVPEIVLTGVNTGDFGIRNGRREDRLIDLIRALEDIEVPRIRISSIEPNLLDPDIVEHVAASDKFMPHFHVPLQSGSDTLLRAMHRRYRTALYRERVQLIKSLMPHAAIGVDVIVGFPGETEELFQETFDFLHGLPISYLHVFPYSERANTRAERLHDAVPMEQRGHRAKQLRSLSEKKRRAFYQEHMNTERPVLWEHEDRDGTMLGFSDNYVRTSAPYHAAVAGCVVPTQLGTLLPTGTVQARPAVADPAQIS